MNKIKIAKVNWYVSNLIKYHVKKHGDFNDIDSYSSQMKKFYNNYYWPGTGIDSSLNSSKYIVKNIFFAPVSSCNLTSLTRAWSKEYNQDIEEDNKIFRNLLKQIIFEKPDIVIIQDGYIFGKGFYDILKESLPNLKAIFVICGTIVPKNQLVNLKEVNAVICICEEISRQFKDVQVNTHILEHAFDLKVLNHLKKTRKIRKVNFMGSVIDEYLGQSCHKFRKEVLIELINKKVPLDIFTPQKNVFKNYKNSYDPLFGIDMFRTSKNYIVNLNIHSDLAKKKAANVRLYELTGIGSCLLTDKSDDINDFFKEDYEIITFSSKEEAVDKAKYLIKNSIKAQRIGRRAQEKTIKYHTFETRVKKFEKILKNYL